ncbi:MAG TPA: Uma2 family endonuclease [Bryobacteraceae bacterium]|nr:Uma2 family endonuclease [Bryobacteraceae bacterium]
MRLTPQEYLDYDRASLKKQEYYDGEIWAIDGANFDHALIACNTAFHLEPALKGHATVFVGASVRIQLSPQGPFTYPDIAIVNGEPEFLDEKRDTLLNPCVVLEVFSKSSEAHLRGFKFTQYRKLRSLSEYALISQSEPRIEVFQRRPSGHWLSADAVGIATRCYLSSVKCPLPLSVVYAGAEFLAVRTRGV